VDRADAKRYLAGLRKKVDILELNWRKLKNRNGRWNPSLETSVKQWIVKRLNFAWGHLYLEMKRCWIIGKLPKTFWTKAERKESQGPTSVLRNAIMWNWWWKCRGLRLITHDNLMRSGPEEPRIDFLHAYEMIGVHSRKFIINAIFIINYPRRICTIKYRKWMAGKKLLNSF